MDNLELTATQIRKRILQMHAKAGSSHIGSAFSIVDILTVIYCRIVNITAQTAKDEKRDRVLLSKGHGGSALYAALASKGILPEAYLDNYCLDGGKLCGHCDHFELAGIEAATGSLGHGLPLANGMALAAKTDNRSSRIFVIMGDGECNEGSVWEAAMFAAHYRLDNICVIVDRNRFQGMGETEKVMGLSPLLEKWQAFGWAGEKINGHDLKQIEEALSKIPFEKNKPAVVIAETVKGKGVSFMENRLEWHYKSPNMDEVRRAMEELNSSGRHYSRNDDK